MRQLMLLCKKQTDFLFKRGGGGEGTKRRGGEEDKGRRGEGEEDEM